MRRSLQIGFVLLALPWPLLAQMQMSSLSGYKAISDLPGPPKDPTISAVTPLWQGVLQQENVLALSGPVTEALREDVIPEGSAPAPGRRTTTLKFDNENHLIENTYRDALGKTKTVNVFQNGKLQSQTTKHRGIDRKFPDWQEWQTWSYDTKGRLSDFRDGQDQAEYNHYLNFKYSPGGRPLGYEYRPSGADGPSTYTEFRYERNKVTMVRFGQNRRIGFEQIYVLDPSNHVIEHSISDAGRSGTLKLWYHTTFKYDDQGRLTEQTTDKYNYAPGDVDSEPPPGRIVIQYDDKKHTGEQDFYSPEGKLLVRSLAEFDAHGYVTKMQVLDADGNEVKSTKGIWVDPKTRKEHSGTFTVEATYDDHGNWTTLQSWFTPDDGGDRILTRSIKQTITYR
jgi:hypothetical protein